MFKKFWLDTILCFLFIVVFVLIVTRITAFNIFSVFDPIGDALADMETTDIVFSHIRAEPFAEKELILVNIGDLPRSGIADLINIINASEPRVIGMDVIFRNPKEDTLADLQLSMAFANVKNLVMYSKLLNEDDDEIFEGLEVSDQGLFNYGVTGFTNFPTGAASQNDLKVCRIFAPSESVNGKEELAFSVKLAQYMNPEATQRFLDRDNDTEIINFRGNIFEFGVHQHSPVTYFALDWHQVLDQEFAPELIKDKAVLFCYLGSQIGDLKTNDDRYYTPLNEKYAGKSHADMYGGVVHANAFSMILSEQYIESMYPEWAVIWTAIILYLNIVLFTVIYKVMPKWYDGLTKVIQLIEAGALFTLGLVVFNFYNYKIDTTFPIIAVLIVGDTLEIYHGVVKNLFTKEGRKELSKLKKL